MRDFDEITEVTLDGVQHTDKNDWQCDNEVPDKINDLWTRGEELEAELTSKPYLGQYYNGTIDDIDIVPAINPVSPPLLYAYNFNVTCTPGGKALIDVIVVDEDVNVLNRFVRTLDYLSTDATYSYASIGIQRVQGYPQTRVYYRIFTKQNGDVCIGHGDIRWE